MVGVLLMLSSPSDAKSAKADLVLRGIIEFKQKNMMFMCVCVCVCGLGLVSCFQ